MPYSREITDLRSPRLRPFASAALAEARRYDSDDLVAIVGRDGRRHTLLAAAAYQFADEAAAEAEERAAADEARREREADDLVKYQARRAGIDAAQRAVEAVAAAAGWTLTWRHGSVGSSYFWLENPADDDGERHSLRISDHVAPGGGGWNDEKQQRHSAPDINVVLRRGADGEYTFDLAPLVETLDR